MMTNKRNRNVVQVILVLLTISIVIFMASCTKKTVIIYKSFMGKITLVYPGSSTPAFESMPTFIWNSLAEAVSYQVQMATDAAFSELIFTKTVTDTSYTRTSQPGNGRYYWRVRAKNGDGIWGDWSEAMVWSFRVNNNTNYVQLLAVEQTPGIAQDVSKSHELLQAKTDFVTIASHQLRTPLSIIKWYIDFLLNGDAGEINSEQKKYL